jgi:hypothetical protein
MIINYIKMKYFFASLILCTTAMISCSEAKVEVTEAEVKSEVTAEIETVELEKIEEDEYSEGSIQSQWDDIVAQVKIGEKANLAMYIDEGAPDFSQEEWSYIDFSEKEYYVVFSSYLSFYDLPNAGDMSEGTKVITVNFETEEDGEVFESTTLIYLVLEDGLIWINGCELIG